MEYDIFATKIAGVTHTNQDGMERQNLIKKLKPGETLVLKREPDNPYDEYAIAVYNTYGQQLGYLPGRDRRLAGHMDMGINVSARVSSITGGYGILGILFPSLRKSWGCNIEITKEFPDEKEKIQIRTGDMGIINLITLAQEHEKENPEKAIEFYREAISAIKKLSSRATSYTRYPINRLSLLLEKLGKYESAYNEIIKFEEYEGYNKITDTDKKSVIKRKNRLKQKIKN